MTKHLPGFTLAELLIALVLVGIMAAFTIPKLIQTNDAQETAAKCREAAYSLEDTFYQLRTIGKLDSASTLYANLMKKYNVVANNSGAITAAELGSATHPCVVESPQGWVQFANGTFITGLAA